MINQTGKKCNSPIYEVPLPISKYTVTIVTIEKIIIPVSIAFLFSVIKFLFY